MQRKPSAPLPYSALSGGGGVCVVDGYGIKVLVERGHLVVEDGFGRERRRNRYNRGTSSLRRLVVIGHAGYVTLEALRWLRDVGAAFVQVDDDATLVATTAPERLHEPRLRRAQVLAGETELGHLAAVQLLRAKLECQAEIAETLLLAIKPTIHRKRRSETISVAAAIREQARMLNPRLPYGEIRKLESIAGRYYWQAWAQVPIQFKRACRADVPEHWHRAGPRTSRLDRQWPRRAQTPAHALLNYGYAILEGEAILAAYKMGLDPSLGLIHADVRYRSSLAADLMEPCRPVVDCAVLDLLEQREFGRSDFFETRRGTCRIGPALRRNLAEKGPELARAVAPHAEELARTLLRARDHPTPLTRRRHRAAIAKAGRD